MDFEELKNILTQYGDKMDDDDIEIFEQAMKVADGKLIVDGKAVLYHKITLLFFCQVYFIPK